MAALEAYDNQDFEKALDYLNGIADSSKILFNIGLIHATLGEHEDAVNFFIKAVELDQYLSVAYFQCGVSNFLLGDFESALQNFSDALLYLRGNTIIDYDQLGLKFRLYSCEVLFNRGLCYLYMGNDTAGMADMEYAAKEKQTEEHGVIDEAIQDRGEGYTVFSIPVGVVYRPNENKVKNAKAKNYLGEARLVAASEAKDAFTGFTGAKVLGDEIARSSAPAPMKPQTTTVIPRAAPPGSGNNRPVSVSINPKNGGGAFPRRSVRGRPPSQILKPVAEVPPPMPFNDGYGEDDLLDAYSRGDEDEMQGSGVPRRMQASRIKGQSRSNSRQGPARGKNGAVRRTKSVASNMTRSTSSGRMRSKYYDEDDFEDEDERGSYGSYSEEYDEEEDEVDDRKSRYVGGKGAKPPPSVRRVKEESPAPQRRGTQRGTVTKKPTQGRNDGRNGSISRRNTTNSRSLSREASKRANRYDQDEEGYISGGYSDYDEQYEEDDDAEFEMVTSRKVAEITKVKVKVHSDDTRVIMVDFKMTYEKLLDKIQDKLHLREEPRIQFRDEDGGMVTMTDQDDLDMALLHAQREARKEAWETGRMEVWCV